MAGVPSTTGGAGGHTRPAEGDRPGLLRRPTPPATARPGRRAAVVLSWLRGEGSLGGLGPRGAARTAGGGSGARPRERGRAARRRGGTIHTCSGHTGGVSLWCAALLAGGWRMSVRDVCVCVCVCVMCVCERERLIDVWIEC